MRFKKGLRAWAVKFQQKPRGGGGGIQFNGGVINVRGFISAAKASPRAMSCEPKSAAVTCVAEKTGPGAEVIRELKGGTEEWRRCGGGREGGRV